MNPIDVSVIIPAHNRVEFIDRSVGSVLRQHGVAVELLFIDDASTDGVEYAFAAMIERHPHIAFKFHRFDNQVGAAKARNWGLDNACGRYIAFLDSDDRFMDEDILFSWVTASDALETEITVAPFCNTKVLDALRAVELSSPVTTARETPMLATLQSFWQLLYRRDFVNRNNLRFPDYLMAREDWPFLVPALLTSDRIGALDRPVLQYFHDAPNSEFKNFSRQSLALLVQALGSINDSFVQFRPTGRLSPTFQAIKTIKYFSHVALFWRTLLNELSLSEDANDAALLRDYMAALVRLPVGLPDFDEIDGIDRFRGLIARHDASRIRQALIDADPAQLIAVIGSCEQLAQWPNPPTT